MYEVCVSNSTQPVMMAYFSDNHVACVNSVSIQTSSLHPEGHQFVPHSYHCATIEGTMSHDGDQNVT